MSLTPTAGTKSRQTCGELLESRRSNFARKWRANQQSDPGNNSAGFFELFNEVVDATLRTQKSLKDQALTKSLEPLTELDFDSYGGGNRPSKTKLVADMRARLSDSPTLTSSLL